MRATLLYALFCVLVLGGFGYAKYQGLAAFGDDLPEGGGRATRNSDGSFTYIGTSGGSHK